MAKIQSFLPYDSSTVTNYKAWAQGIGNALSSFGWTKTADEGQVNWSNVTSPPANFEPTPISSTILGLGPAGHPTPR